MTALGAAALDASPFSAQVLDALVAAIDVNDRIDLDADLPASVVLDYPPGHFLDGFRLSRQLWRDGFDRPAMVALAGLLRRGGPADEEARRRLKQVRARFKHLRFAFFLYSAAHRSPAMLSLVTLEMGELQDSLRVRGAQDVRRHARRLRLLLGAPFHRLLARETDRLVPTDAAGFRRFVLAQVASLRPMLAAPVTGAHAFHAARKVVSRQVSFHDDMRTLHPSAGHVAMARALATINGLMGQFHDELVARDAAGSFSYRHDAFALPPRIRVRLEALVDLYLGTGDPCPPSARTVAS